VTSHDTLCRKKLLELLDGLNRDSDITQYNNCFSLFILIKESSKALFYEHEIISY
jgi:hypothetical protein